MIARLTKISHLFKNGGYNTHLVTFNLTVNDVWLLWWQPVATMWTYLVWILRSYCQDICTILSQCVSDGMSLQSVAVTRDLRVDQIVYRHRQKPPPFFCGLWSLHKLCLYSLVRWIWKPWSKGKRLPFCEKVSGFKVSNWHFPLVRKNSPEFDNLFGSVLLSGRFRNSKAIIASPSTFLQLWLN